MASVEAHEGGVALDREAPAGRDAFGLHPREVDDDTIVAQGTAGDVVSATSKIDDQCKAPCIAIPPA
ncbi:MAG TPA: hypothetical protein VF905_04110 [Nitrospirota bacterium]